jgi:hypothetical protein
LTVLASGAHQQRFIVTFDAISTRDEAERWRGVVLSAPRLDDESVIWIDQLYDAEVFDAQGIRRGVVTGVEANPASDLLVLDSGALVPLTFVTNVDANVRIDVDVARRTLRMTLRVDALTLFPDALTHYASTSVLGRALERHVWELHVHDFRDATSDPHRSVDDTPFGGRCGHGAARRTDPGDTR